MPCHRTHFTPGKTCQRITLDGKGAKMARVTSADRSSFGSQTNYGEITRKSPRCQVNIRIRFSDHTPSMSPNDHYSPTGRIAFCLEMFYISSTAYRKYASLAAQITLYPYEESGTTTGTGFTKWTYRLIGERISPIRDHCISRTPYQKTWRSSLQPGGITLFEPELAASVR